MGMAWGAHAPPRGHSATIPRAVPCQRVRARPGVRGRCSRLWLQRTCSLARIPRLSWRASFRHGPCPCTFLHAWDGHACLQCLLALLCLHIYSTLAFGNEEEDFRAVEVPSCAVKSPRPCQGQVSLLKGHRCISMWECISPRPVADQGVQACLGKLQRVCFILCLMSGSWSGQV